MMLVGWQEMKGREAYNAVGWESVGVWRADLTVLLAWSARSLADLEDSRVLRKRGGSHGEAEGEGGESRELHFGMLEGAKA
jgi:hypothetical protein